MQYLGSTYQKVRKNKGISQEVACEGIISRTTLSKFENNTSAPSNRVFLELVDRLDLSIDEFSYIHNGYKNNEKNSMVENFFSQFSNQDLNYLKNIQNECEIYLEKHASTNISLLRTIIDSQISLFENIESKIDCLSKIFITKTWQELQNRSQWYYDEIRLLNCCLFLLPSEQIEHFGDTLINRLDKYAEFRDIRPLKCTLLLNISLIFISNDDKRKSTNYLKKAMQISKKINRSDYYALAISRYGIVTSSTNLITKGIMISNLFENTLLTKLILNEKEKYFDLSN